MPLQDPGTSPPFSPHTRVPLALLKLKYSHLILNQYFAQL